MTAENDPRALARRFVQEVLDDAERATSGASFDADTEPLSNSSQHGSLNVAPDAPPPPPSEARRVAHRIVEESIREDIERRRRSISQPTPPLLHDEPVTQAADFRDVATQEHP